MICLCTIPSMGGSCKGCPNNTAPVPDFTVGDYKPLFDEMQPEAIEEFRRLVRRLRAEGKL